LGNFDADACANARRARLDHSAGVFDSLNAARRFYAKFRAYDLTHQCNVFDSGAAF
jgi:hypothetical protein